MENKQS